MNEEQKYIDFESYERVAEPHKRERVSAWHEFRDVAVADSSFFAKEIHEPWQY